MGIDELREWAQRVCSESSDHECEFSDLDDELSDALSGLVAAASEVMALCDDREPPALEFE